MFLGAYLGFEALLEAGWIDRLPKLLGAQAAGYAPIAAALHGESKPSGDDGIADGIQIRNPVQEDSILDAVAATDGDVIELPRTRSRRRSIDYTKRDSIPNRPAPSLPLHSKRTGIAASSVPKTRWSFRYPGAV